MSLFRSKRPVICKVHGFAVAADRTSPVLDIVIMAEDARIGYRPCACGAVRPRPCALSSGAGEGQAHAVTGDKIDGREAEKLGLVLKAVPADRLDEEVDALATHRDGAAEQLTMQKLMSTRLWPTWACRRRR